MAACGALAWDRCVPQADRCAGEKIEGIEEAQAKKQWSQMTATHDARLSGWRNFDRKNIDVDAAMKTAKTMSDIRLNMLRNRLETAKQIRAVLSNAQQQQRLQMRRWGGE